MKRLEGWAAALLGLGGLSWGVVEVMGLDPSSSLAAGPATALFATVAVVYVVVGAGAVVQAPQRVARRQRYLASRTR